MFDRFCHYGATGAHIDLVLVTLSFQLFANTSSRRRAKRRCRLLDGLVSYLQLVAISGSLLDSCLDCFAEITDSVAIRDGQITKVNETTLMGVDVVPDFGHVFTGE